MLESGVDVRLAGVAAVGWRDRRRSAALERAREALEFDGVGIDERHRGELLAVEQKANALSVLDQVTKLLELPPDATPEQIIAALNAELEKAKTAVENQAKLDELAATAEREEHARLVAKGRAERKIVDADMDYVNSLDSKALCAYLDHAAPKVPAPLPKEAGRKPDQDAVVLTAEDKAVCRRLNIPEDKFLTAKTERAK